MENAWDVCHFKGARHIVSACSYGELAQCHFHKAEWVVSGLSRVHLELLFGAALKEMCVGGGYREGTPPGCISAVTHLSWDSPLPIPFCYPKACFLQWKFHSEHFPLLSWLGVSICLPTYLCATAGQGRERGGENLQSHVLSLFYPHHLDKGERELVAALVFSSTLEWRHRVKK